MRHRDLILGIPAVLLACVLGAWALSPDDVSPTVSAGATARASRHAAPTRANAEGITFSPPATSSAAASPDEPREEPTLQAAPAPAGPPAAPITPEGKLGRELGLSAEETERVGEAIRAADEQLRADMAALAERGYDDVLARRLSERFEEELLARVEAALPEARRPAFRVIVGQELRQVDAR